MERQAAPNAGKSDAAAANTSSKAWKAKAAKQPTPAPSKAPSNNAATAEDDGMFGGMFGIFDGACDSMGLDGAGDERPIFTHGRVNLHPPPGFIWDGTRGDFRTDDPSPPGMPGAFPEQMPDAEPDGRARAKAFVANAMQEAQNAQLDGPRDWRSTRGGAYAGQQRDDLRGDKYLGMTGRDRSEYKQFFRERGDTVSQTPRPVTGIDIMEGFVCNTGTAAEVIRKAPPDAKDTARFFTAAEDKGYYENTPAGARLLTGDLERVRRDLIDQDQKTPRLNTRDAWRDWRLMEAKLRSMGPGKRCGPSHFSRAPGVQAAEAQTSFPALEEALEDVQLLRAKLQVIGQSGAGPQVSGMLDRLQQAESDVMEDSLWSGPPPHNELDALNTRREQLRRRNNLMSEVVSAIDKIKPGYNVDIIATRVEQVCEEGRQAGKRISQLEGKVPASARPGAVEASLATPRHVNFEQGYDGAPHQSGNPRVPTPASFWGNATGGNDRQGMGEQTWKQSAQAGSKKQPSTHEHFSNKGLNKAHEGCELGANAGASSHAGSRRSERNGWAGDSQKNQGTGWDDDQQHDRAWQGPKPDDKAPSNTGWEDQGSNKDANAGWGNGGSEHPSQNNGGGGWNDGDQGGAAWDIQGKKSQGKSEGWANAPAQSNKSHSQGDGWGNDAPASNGNASRSGARSSRGSTASNPKELIKPYWKDWDKAGNQRSGSQAGSTRVRAAAREAYAYPAAK